MRLGLNAHAESDKKICCVDFFGNPAGLQTREECQFNGGDVAPANRCEAPSDGNSPQVGGVALPEQIAQPTHRSKMPQQFAASGDVALKWFLPELVRYSRSEPMWKQPIYSSNAQWQLQVVGAPEVWAVNPNSRSAEVTIECHERRWSTGKSQAGKAIDVIDLSSFETALLDPPSVGPVAQCLVSSNVPIFVFADNIEEIYQRHIENERPDRWLNWRKRQLPAIRIE